MISLGKCVALVGCGLAVLATNALAQNMKRSEARLSIVTLLAVERGPGRGDLQTVSGSEDGLIFHFLVERREGVKGLFTLNEVRDFELNGRKYSELTRGQLGRTFEPSTVLEDVANFRSTIRPDLRDAIPSTAREPAVVMSVVLSGCALATGELAAIGIDVGWGEKSEPFRFAFRVPGK